MKLLLRITLLFLLGNVCARAEYKDYSKGIKLNNVPGVFDESAKTVFFSLLPNVGNDIEAIFTSSHSFDSLWLNGKPCKDVAVKIDQWKSSDHFLKIRLNDGTESSYKLSFTTLPIVVITYKKDRFVQGDIKRLGNFAIIDPMCRTNGKDIVFTHDAGMRVRGATASGFKKQSIGVELWDKDSVEVDTTVLGIRSDGDWVLEAMYVDPSRMRNRICMDIWNSIDDLPYSKDNEYQYNGTRGYYVEMMFNGSYNGLYCLTDKIDRKKLNLKKYKDNGDGTITQRGLLWKGRKNTEATSLFGYSQKARQDTLWWDGWEQMYPDESSDQAYWQPLIDLNKFCSPKLNYDFEWLERDMDTYIDFDNFIRYNLFTNAFTITDNLLKNTFFSIRNISTGNRQIRITPWDMDASFGRDFAGVISPQTAYGEICTAKWGYSSVCTKRTRATIKLVPAICGTR